MPDLSLPNLIGIAAGLAILGVGTFVLLTRPHAWLHRVFFLLALADGASTLFFRLSYVVDHAQAASLLRGLYWWSFFAFVGLLCAFGALFPKPVPRRRPWVGVALAAGVALGGAALYVLARDLFFTVEMRAGRPAFSTPPLGNLSLSAFVLVTALLVGRLTHDLQRETSASHRRQSAMVLGGMTLAYAPYATTSLVTGAVADAQGAFLSARLDRAFAYWAFVALVAGIATSAWRLWRVQDEARQAERRFALRCYAGVLALTLLAFVPAPAFTTLLRMVALLTYPILLGYAIVRYEVFDIDAKLRRAATVTLVAATLATVFVLGENLLEGALAETLALGISSQLAASAIAALATALLSIPVVKASRKAARRVIPELSHDALQARKLEVYRHGLAGALADGLIAERESRTLLALRESLGITQEDHERILHELLGARRLAVQPGAGRAREAA